MFQLPSDEASQSAKIVVNRNARSKHSFQK